MSMEKMPSNESDAENSSELEVSRENVEKAFEVMGRALNVRVYHTLETVQYWLNHDEEFSGARKRDVLQVLNNLIKEMNALPEVKAYDMLGDAYFNLQAEAHKTDK